MSEFNIGDIFTFRLHEDYFGMGRIIQIEDLSQFDRMHVQIYDAVIEAGPGGIDEHGDPYPRSHDLSGFAQPSLVVDHLCLDLDFFVASEPVIVDHREVVSDDLTGYRVWLQLQHDRMVSLGMISARDSAPDGMEEDVDEEAVEDDTDDIEAGGDVGEESSEEQREELVTVELRPWHQIILREPIGAGLVRMHDVFALEGLRTSTLGKYLAGIYSAENVEEISSLVDALLSGDFGAGQELMEYGDAAVRPLSEHLAAGQLDAQQTEDVVNILTDIATPLAYEQIASHFERCQDRLDSEIGKGVARAYCYAVMLTGGAPDPLRRLLPLLDRIDHPGLREDVANARAAVMNAGPPDPQSPEQAGTSSSPFGTLGV